MSRSTLALPLLAAVLAACSGAGVTSGGVHPMSVTFNGNAPVAAVPNLVSASRVSAATASVSAGVTVSDSTDTLVITRAELVMSKLDLSLATSGTCPDTGTMQETECDELESGPLLVDLPLSGSATSSLGVSVPAGTYHQIAFKIALLSGTDTAAANFLAAHPEMNGASVRVEGTYNGAPFTFTSVVEAETELEFSPAFVVDANGKNITVSVDVGSWFRSSNGAVIDPNSADPGGLNEALVDGNIKASFQGYEDDNRDGVKDN